ncbi:hypothetical protein SAMN04488055_3124 [Chitinophaga niabensis]|uniref:Uncharacterized protein n=1 Tax=Chitinophaga niabensis TaxID=536979 RepID=A0A1N6H1Q9_9BACT|nr:hypothetical protein SAMN04488055_3124 [Chitinophaga niabensis]
MFIGVGRLPYKFVAFRARKEPDRLIRIYITKDRV